MLLSVAAFIVVIGVLIFVHELGHFAVAKLTGVQVLRFSLGFGRPLIAWRRGETEYWISWIPVGGYVKMAGLEDEGLEALEGKSTAPVDPTRAFDRKPLAVRMAVMLAGVTMNVALAVVVYWALFATLGTPRRATTRLDWVVADKLPRAAGAAALAALPPGTRVLRVNDDTVRGWDDVAEALLRPPRLEYRFVVAGRAEPLVVTFPDSNRVDRLKLLIAMIPVEPARLGVVQPGLPASRGGLKPEDLIVRIGGDSIASWGDVLKRVWVSAGRPLQMEVERGRGATARRLTVTVTPIDQVERDSLSPHPAHYGFIGVENLYETAHDPQPLGRAGVIALQNTAAAAGTIVGFLRDLVAGRGSLRDLGGPILIGQMSGQVARLGLERFLGFLALFSVNLAVLNLLPIPVLDGGQLVFLLAEAVRRKPLSLELRLRLSQVGLAIILIIMLLAVSNDVLRSIVH